MRCGFFPFDVDHFFQLAVDLCILMTRNDFELTGWIHINTSFNDRFSCQQQQEVAYSFLSHRQVFKNHKKRNSH